MVTMSSVLNSSLTAAAAKFGKENPSRAGLIPLAAEVKATLRMSGALGSTGAELPPEQAEATIATVAMTAKNRCLNHINFTLLHILSNYGSEAPEHWVCWVFQASKSCPWSLDRQADRSPIFTRGPTPHWVKKRLLRIHQCQVCRMCTHDFLKVQKVTFPW
jgi:hypothetical protein